MRQEELMSDSELDPKVAPEGPSPEDDQRLGVGGAAQAANLALLALTRAARSFLVYDARNDAIRGERSGHSNAQGKKSKRQGSGQALCFTPHH